jgi:hypothetical protein
VHGGKRSKERENYLDTKLSLTVVFGSLGSTSCLSKIASMSYFCTKAQFYEDSLKSSFVLVVFLYYKEIPNLLKNRGFFGSLFWRFK